MVLAFPELKPRKVAKPELTSDGQEKEEVVVATDGDFKMEGTVLCIDVYFLRMTVDQRKAQLRLLAQRWQPELASESTQKEIEQEHLIAELKQQLAEAKKTGEKKYSTMKANIMQMLEDR